MIRLTTYSATKMGKSSSGPRGVSTTEGALWAPIGMGIISMGEGEISSGLEVKWQRRDRAG